MKFANSVSLVAITAWAQSPHVFHKNMMPRLDGQVNKFFIDGVTQLSSNGPEEAVPLNTYLKRQGTEPPGRDQEKRRPPMFPLADCYWCPKKKVLDGPPMELLNVFTTDEFQRRTRAEPEDLRDTCVFYTRAVNKPPDALSKIATKLACNYGKYSIWHLWPNRINENSDSQLLNYYGILDPTNRLYPISQIFEGKIKKGQIQYFENMSRAMANMCTGKVYLVTQTPLNLKLYKTGEPNIWNNVEWPALKNRFEEVADTLVVIEAGSEPPKAWSVSWRTLAAQYEVPFPRRDSNIPAGWEPYDLAGELNATAILQRKALGGLCQSSGVDDEPAGMDFFG